MIKHWRIDITDNTERRIVRVVMKNMLTGATRTADGGYDNDEDRNEVIGDLFAGPSPNIRDDFDKL